MKKKIVDVRLQLNTFKLVTIEQNRKMLSSIVKTITLIGHHEIALRIHRNSGPISLELPTYNDRNFRSL